MGRGKEQHKLRLEEGYRKELKAHAESQEALADAVGANQSTVSRVLAGGPTTFDMAMRMSEAVEHMPPPLVTIQNIDHYRWCQLGAALLKADPARFAKAIDHASQLAAFAGISDDEWEVRLPPLSEEATSKIDAVFKNPLRTDRKTTR
jgi:transcriptional regulator with XRE-family HTH domain